MTEALLPSPPDVALLPDAALVLDAQGLVRVCEPARGGRCSPSSPTGLRARRADPGARTALGGDRRGRSRDDGAGDPARRAGARTASPSRSTSACACSPDGGLLCVLRELDRNAPGTLDAAFDAMPIGMALLQHRRRVRPRQRRAVRAARPRRRTSCSGCATRSSRTRTTVRATSTPPGASSTARSSTWQCEKRFVRPDGSIVWTLASLTFLRDEYGRPLCWVGQFQDVTELRRMASRDPLTDALNRRAFDVELERARGRVAAGARPRRLQGHQRRPRPPRRRRAAAPDRGRDPRAAAARRRARAPRRGRVRGAAAALRRGARRSSWPTTWPRWSRASGSSSTASSAA